MKGRKPVPSHLKLLRGNPGKRRVNEAEPRPKTETPSCPPDLSKAARKEWRRVSRELEVLGMLTTIDRAALAAYCESWARWRDAERKLAETSLVMKTKSGNVIENPYYSICKRERELMLRFLVEFGMTPSARTRLSIVPQDNNDPLENWLQHG